MHYEQSDLQGHCGGFHVLLHCSIPITYTNTVLVSTFQAAIGFSSSQYSENICRDLKTCLKEILEHFFGVKVKLCLCCNAAARN